MPFAQDEAAKSHSPIYTGKNLKPVSSRNFSTTESVSFAFITIELAINMKTHLFPKQSMHLYTNK